MSTRPGTLKFRKGSRGDYRWRVVSGFEVITTSPEGYPTMESARDHVMQLLAALEGWYALIRDPDRTPTLLLPDIKFTPSTLLGGYRWRVVAHSGRILGASNKSFETLGATEHNVTVLLRALSYWASELASGRPYDDLDGTPRTTGQWNSAVAAPDDDSDGA